MGTQQSGYDPVAENVIHWFHSIQMDFNGKNHSYIREKFAGVLQNNLCMLGYKCQVIWTPEEEKFLQKEAENIDADEQAASGSNNYDTINDILYSLNDDYRSLDYLRSLAEVLHSRIFHIKYLDDGLHFVIQSTREKVVEDNVHEYPNGAIGPIRFHADFL